MNVLGQFTNQNIGLSYQNKQDNLSSLKWLYLVFKTFMQLKKKILINNFLFEISDVF